MAEELKDLAGAVSNEKTSVTGNTNPRCPSCGERMYWGAATKVWMCDDCKLATNTQGKPAPTMVSSQGPSSDRAVRSKDADGHRFDLISPIGLTRLAATYAEGAAKYGEENYLKGFRHTDVVNHAERHIALWKAGDRNEDHLAHAAWNLFTLMHYEEMAIGEPICEVRQCWGANSLKELASPK